MNQFSMTGQEIIDRLKGAGLSVGNFAYDGLDYLDDDGVDDDTLVGDIGECKEVESYGGEDCGSTWFKVYYFPKHDVYLRVDGWYQSYNGVDFNGWEDVKEVKPKEKVITVYE